MTTGRTSTLQIVQAEHTSATTARARAAVRAQWRCRLVLLAHANVYQYARLGAAPKCHRYRRVGVRPPPPTRRRTARPATARLRSAEDGLPPHAFPAARRHPAARLHASQLPLVGTGTRAARAFCCSRYLRERHVRHRRAPRVGHIIAQRATTRHGGGRHDARHARARAREPRPGPACRRTRCWRRRRCAGGARVVDARGLLWREPGRGDGHTKVAVHESGVHACCSRAATCRRARCSRRARPRGSTRTGAAGALALSFRFSAR